MHFKRANTEPIMDFRKANTELSIPFRRANKETYYKYNVNLTAVIYELAVKYKLPTVRPAELTPLHLLHTDPSTHAAH